MFSACEEAVLRANGYEMTEKGSYAQSAEGFVGEITKRGSGVVDAQIFTSKGVPVASPEKEGFPSVLSAAEWIFDTFEFFGVEHGMHLIP